jgi:phosphotransacetylase
MMKIETNQNISSITNDNDPYHDTLSELLQEEDILDEQVQRQLKESTVLA